MKFYPITLGTGREGNVKPKQSSDSGADPQELRIRIFERDDYVCGCCGFRSEKYQEILHINGDKTDFSDENLLTTCVFCHACFDLIQVDEMKSGVLVWLPEINQSSLHHIMRAIYIGRISQGSVSDAARKALDILMARREECKKRIGTDDPGVLAGVLNDFLERGRYDARADLLKGVRLLPLDRRMKKDGEMDFNQFPQILAYWRSKSGPYAELNPKNWPQLLTGTE